MAVIYVPHFVQFFDNNGNPLSGGRLFTYVAGTTTPKATFTAEDGLTPNANPIVLDSSGRATLFIQGAYKFRLETSAGVLVRETDNVQSFEIAGAATGAINWATADTIPSAASIDLGAATSNYVIVTGTTSITSLGTVAQGAERLLRFTGVLTLTHNGTSLILPNNANITTAAGDFARFISEGSGNWRLTEYQGFNYPTIQSIGTGLTLSSGQLRFANGTVVDRAYAEYTANADLTATIPLDDTIPQNTEGTQILSATITPKTTTNRLRIRVRAWGAVATTTELLVMAIFRNTDANAISAGIGSQAIAATGFVSTVLEYEFVPASTATQTINVRVGASTGTLRLNGTLSARRFGGASACTLVIEEITA
jgi:hypothetical protein